MSYPIIRKGQVYTPVPTGYGASVERYQRRYSKKDEAKLMKKMAKYQDRIAKLEAKTSRFGAKRRARTIIRLQKKVLAIQQVLGMQPFEANISQQAYDDQMAIAMQGDNSVLWWGLGLLAVGAVTFVVVKSSKGKSKKA